MPEWFNVAVEWMVWIGLASAFVGLTLGLLLERTSHEAPLEVTHVPDAGDDDADFGWVLGDVANPPPVLEPDDCPRLPRLVRRPHSQPAVDMWLLNRDQVTADDRRRSQQGS